MAPILKVLLPSQGSSYPPTQACRVNSSQPIPIRTKHFEGFISIWVKGYNGLKKESDGDAYFGSKGREGNTYAVVIRGRFLCDVSADDIVFGNIFEKPVRDRLPWGTSVAMKFINWVDPTVKMDPYADKPFALGPLLASMNYVSIQYAKDGSANATQSPLVTVTEQSSEATSKLLQPNDGSGQVTSSPDWEDDSPQGVKARRKWYSDASNRKAIKLGPDWETEVEFGNGLIDFNTLEVVLPQPFSLHIPLLKYWDGQPATYVCRSKDGDKVFWSVAFQIHERDGDGGEGGGGGSEADDDDVDATPNDVTLPPKKPESQNEGISDDVD